MKKLIFILVILVGCSSSSEEMKEVVKGFYGLCKSKVSSKLVISNWNSYVEFNCADLKQEDD